MNQAQKQVMLRRRGGVIDIVLDTDTFNEVDDQYALSYLLHSEDRLRLRAIYAAPFANEKAATPREGSSSGCPGQTLPHWRSCFSSSTVYLPVRASTA